MQLVISEKNQQQIENLISQANYFLANNVAKTPQNLSQAAQIANQILQDFDNKNISALLILGDVFLYQQKIMTALQKYNLAMEFCLQKISKQKDYFFDNFADLMAFYKLASVLRNIGESKTAKFILNYFETRLNAYKKYFATVTTDFIKLQKLTNYQENLYFLQLWVDTYLGELAAKNKLFDFYQQNPLVTKFSHSIKNQNQNQNQKLKIAFVSGDLRFHPVSHFLLHLLQQPILQQTFEFSAFSTRGSDDQISQQIRALCQNRWFDISALDDKSAAEQIFHENIDFLFDLSGLTIGNRLGIFRYRPAKIQISWIGWFATTALPEMDFFISDEFCIKNADKNGEQFCEKIIQMPHIWECFDANVVKNFNIKKSAKKDDFFTFANFNNPAKVSPQTLNLWAEILQKSPKNVRFIWQRAEFNEPEFQQKILQEFQKRGVNSMQILLQNYPGYENYLQTIQSSDLLLDTFPVSGMTITAEALALGIPVLTLLGDLMPSRLSGSCINAIGDENLRKNLICHDQNAYVNQAVFFANNPDFLQNLTQNLAQKVAKSPLCDIALFAENFKQQLLQCWKKYQKA